MKVRTLAVATVAALMTLGPVACDNAGAPVLTHRLVATGNQKSVPLYPDEETLVEVSHRAQQGGVTGMVGSVEKNFSAKQIDDQTPVQVISTDENGAHVEIVDGPLRGQSGFVAKQNVS